MSWLTVAEVRTHLGKSSSADDEELYGFILAAESMIDDLMGTVLPSTTPREEWQRGGCTTVILDQCPVAAVVEVSQNGTVIPQADLDDPQAVGWYASDLDMGGGLLRHTSWFSYGSRVKVTYHPGLLVIPNNYRLAGLALTAHLWQMEKNGTMGVNASRLGESSSDPIVFRGFALPARVRELLGLGKRATSETLVG